MLNRPIHSLHDPDDDDLSPGWDMDERPGLRLWLLFGAVFACVVAIAARFAYVQTTLGETYAAEFDKTYERREPIPSRDGRILTADGAVLAEDLELFGVTVHYRWLEEPPDPDWLRQQALARLSRAERRNPERVATETERVLSLRAALWNRLAGATGLAESALVARRRAVQTQVEKIYSLVEQRRAAREQPQGVGSLFPADEGPRDIDAQSCLKKTPDPFARTREEASWWERIWNDAVVALTTSPQREQVEPLVIREQLDYHLLIPEVSRETAVEIEGRPELYPGVRIAVSTRRVYPQGTLAPHVVGYRAAISDEKLAARREQFPHGDPLDYRHGDRIGMAGLEKYYERHLRGLRGERKLVFNRRGEVVREEIVREPRYGRDIVIALNVPLQQAAESLLDDALNRQHADETNGKPLPIPPGGAIVAIDVRTGAVLAAASAPRFDLGLFTNPDTNAWKQTIADPRKPLFHRAAEMTLPPGSVFKVASAIAFLEQGAVDPDRAFHCQGFLDHEDMYRCLVFKNYGVGHGDITFVDAMARSCNVYFFNAARRMGAAPLHGWAYTLGFGHPTGIDLPAERSGTLPAAPSPPSSRNGNARALSVSGDTLQFAIGQSKLTATPLQVARMMAAVANGGNLVTPHFVEAFGPSSFEPVSADDASSELSATTSAKPIPGLSSRTLEWVRLGLRQVVAHPQGTGYKTVRLPDIPIAGKTGTAEPGGGKPDHAWFAGYAPADRPRIAFVVVLEHAGSGGHAAGPLARKIVQAMQQQHLLGTGELRAPNAD
jgi:penicillin-binding protein 2